MDKAAIDTRAGEARGGRALSFEPVRKLFRHFFAKEDSREAALARDKRALLKELDETLFELRCARMNFEQAVAPEMIEASIFEIKSAEARYDFLIRKAKNAGLTHSHFQP